MRVPGPPSDTSTEWGTGIIAPVIAADPLVGPHRRILDRSAQWEVPPHVTILTPFLPPQAVTEAVIVRLQTALQTTAAFSCRFERTRWFGQDVLWLEPRPADPFRQMTMAVWTAFPDFPPYGGAADDVIPHLTIGERSTAGYEAMQVAEQRLQPTLPIATVIDHIQLIGGDSATGCWWIIQEFPLTSSADRIG